MALERLLYLLQQDTFMSAPPANITPCLADPVLHRILLQCSYSSVAPSTQKTYQSGLNTFNKFCSDFGKPPSQLHH